MQQAGRKGRAWMVLAPGVVLIGALILGLTRQARHQAAATVPPRSQAAAVTPPDISGLTPRQRFDRLYDRIMTAAEQGDGATMSQFTPMALAAYGQLDSIDTEARFRAALLALHTGQIPGALALADTILAQHPGDLLGYLVQANAARWQRNDAALQPIYREFLAHYDIEMKSGRPEYQAHGDALRRLHDEALAGGGS